MSKETSLPHYDTTVSAGRAGRNKSPRSWFVNVLEITVLMFGARALWETLYGGRHDLVDNMARRAQACAQETPLIPSNGILDALEAIYRSEGFLSRSVAWLGGAVQIP